MASLLEKNKKTEEEKEVLEEKVRELYEEIVRLSTQMNWLKKIWHQSSVEKIGLTKPLWTSVQRGLVKVLTSLLSF